ncbi:hypothetical protein AAE02nite_10510 [Adhaeribacter aerolatus]|uniref:Putative beta-lactamase-inhibitor-like PepSY-like domain-containing protein n=2 Tax=Adhaeribacter aerolatus TaxID=670289 RepID=A0A512AV28_9BACT|nr:hypothetical protein AAE02nite_10510 [Adhaeribacter aerolatus]
MAFYSCEKNEVEPTDDAALVELALLATADDGSGTTTSTPTKTKNGCNLNQVAVTDLPSAVTTYITTNYANATIERAAKIEAGGYLVHLKKADGTNVGLVFDASGSFVSEKAHPKNHGTPVAVTDLPVTITNYVAGNYSGATIAKAMKNDSGNYVVVVKKSDASVVGVAFAADGTFTGEVTVKGKGGGRHGKKHK